ncbi:hypothetical protein [Thiohalocapsa marina]|uniref:hypothetical protein n=1 Tax=Thiohalocapsa marina TaxID=424902 RepID=UPI0036DC3E65
MARYEHLPIFRAACARLISAIGRPVQASQRPRFVFATSILGAGDVEMERSSLQTNPGNLQTNEWLCPSILISGLLS